MIILIEDGKYFELMSNSYVESLLRDGSDDVRRTLASSLHELIIQIGVNR